MSQHITLNKDSRGASDRARAETARIAAENAKDIAESAVGGALRDETEVFRDETEIFRNATEIFKNEANQSSEAAEDSKLSAIQSASTSEQNKIDSETSKNLAQAAVVDALSAVGIDPDYISYVYGVLPDSTGAIVGTNGAYYSDNGFIRIEWDGVEWDERGFALALKSQVDSVAEKAYLDLINYYGIYSDISIANYVGNGSVIPIVTDKNLRVLIGYDIINDEIIYPGIDSIQSTIDLGFTKYNGSSIYPIISDKNGRIILGYDSINDKIIPEINSETQLVEKTSVELPEKIQLKGINHVISYGQSLSVGAQGKPPISTTQPYSNITFQGGPRAYDGSDFIWTPFKPLVEDQVSPAPDGNTTRGETVCSGLANYASTSLLKKGIAPNEHIILGSSAGKGSASISELEKGTEWYNTVFMEHIFQAHFINNDYALQVIAWLQGETDQNTGMSREVYSSKIANLINDINSDVSILIEQNSPVYMLTYQMSFGARINNANVQLATLDQAKNNNKVYLATPIYHIPHVNDNVHLSNIGYKWVGAYFGRAYAEIVLGNKPKFINPLSAINYVDHIEILFDVPIEPLVLDVDTLAPTTDFGFKVTDDTGVLGIESVITTRSSVKIYLSRALDDNAVVKYGMDYLGLGLTITNGGSGNLRDSNTETVTIDGLVKPLYNVCPIFQLSINNIGF